MESIMDSLAVFVGKIKYSGIPVFLAVSLMLSACSSAPSEEHGHDHHEEDKSFVELTPDQLKEIDLKIGFAEKRAVLSDLELSGRLQVAPQNEASITSMIGASVKQINVIEGDKVSKGQILAYLHHPSLLELQSQYLEAVHALKLARQNFERDSKLYKDEASSGKQYQASEFAYKCAKSHQEGLASRLKLIGLNPQQVELNGIREEVPVRSPLDGYIHKVQVKTGQFVQADKSLFEVFNREHMHADFMVFEKDVHRVHEGQIISFTTPSLPGKRFDCEVYSVGKAFEEEPKAIHIHADIQGERLKLLPGMYVQGRIQSKAETVLALPNEAVVLEGEEYYAFVLTDTSDHWKFKPMTLKVIDRGSEFTAIELPTDFKGKFALTEAYTLLSEWKKEEGGHHHH